jgi:hypothetical protein
VIAVSSAKGGVGKSTVAGGLLTLPCFLGFSHFLSGAFTNDDVYRVLSMNILFDQG